MWAVSNSLQLLNLFRSIIFGIIFCLCYDVLRALRKVYSYRTFTVFLQDIIVSSVLACATFIFLLATTNGQLRMFVVVGMALGFLISRLTVSRIFLPLLTTSCSRLSVFFSSIFGRIYHSFDILEKNIIKNSKKSIKTLKKLLKKVAGLLYTKWRR